MAARISVMDMYKKALDGNWRGFISKLDEVV
jgi:hypothetical protein